MKRVDRNHKEIVRGLRAVGATVRSTADIGQGFPDIAVGFRRQNWLFEIKDLEKPPSQRRLTPDEQAFHEGWQGQVCIVYTLSDALRAIGATR